MYFIWEVYYMKEENRRYAEEAFEIVEHAAKKSAHVCPAPTAKRVRGLYGR